MAINIEKPEHKTRSLKLKPKQIKRVCSRKVKPVLVREVIAIVTLLVLKSGQVRVSALKESAPHPLT